MKNGNTLQDTIGNLDIDTNDNITEQLSSLRNTTNQLNDNKLNKSDINNYVPPVVTSWLNNNVNPVGSAVTIDKSLSIEGSAADAKTVGDELTNVKETINADNATTIQALTLRDDIAITTWFVQGSISATGAETVSYIRIRSDYIDLNAYESITITPSSGYLVAVELFDNMRAFKKELGFTPNSRYINVGSGTYDAYYVRLLLAHTDHSAITPNEGTNVSITAKTIVKSQLDKLTKIDNLFRNEINDADSWDYGAVLTSSGLINNTDNTIHSDYIVASKGDVVFSQWVLATRAGFARFEVMLFDGNLKPLNISTGTI